MLQTPGRPRPTCINATLQATASLRLPVRIGGTPVSAMRMRFCASVLALTLLSNAGAAQSTQDGGKKQPTGARARLTVRTPEGRDLRERVTLDRTVVKG